MNNTDREEFERAICPDDRLWTYIITDPKRLNNAWQWVETYALKKQKEVLGEYEYLDSSGFVIKDRIKEINSKLDE